MSDVIEANDKWVLAMLKVDPVVLRTLPNGGAPAPEPQAAEPTVVNSLGIGLNAAPNPYSYVSDPATPGAGQPAPAAVSEPATVNSLGIDPNAAPNPYSYVSGPATPGAGQPAPVEASGPANTGTPHYSTELGAIVPEEGGNGGGNGTGSPPGPVPAAAQGNAAAPAQLSPDELVQAMRDKMPLTTTTPEWAKDIDMAQARVGKEIKSGNFGTMSWVGGVDGQSLVIKTGKIGGDQEQLLANCATLANEADAYQKVGDHPNIAKCMGIKEVGGQRGLVLEGVRGKDMNGTMTRLEKLRTGDKAEMKKLGLSQPLSQPEFVGMQQFMLTETLKGLQAVEQAGVVHSDIRPDNIMVDKETGGIKLVDFGIAVDAGKRPKTAPIGFGSVGPEFNQPDTGMTPKFDVFAAGEIARKGMERDQFRYGGTSQFGQAGFTKDFKEFGKMDADGKPLHQALEPQAAPPASSRDKDDHAGRLADLRSVVKPILDDDFMQNGAWQVSAISGDKTNVAQLREAMKLCEGVFRDYERAQRTGDTYGLMAAEKLDKVLADVERLLPRVKATGTYGAETEYTKFVNWAMNPDPALRPSAADALKHRFLADALMDEASARELMKKVLADA